MFTYLGFCRVFSFLFFLWLLGFHNTLTERCPQDPGVWIHSKEKLFLFSQSSLWGMNLESAFLPSPKLCVFALQRTNSNWLYSEVWKMTMCWLFGCLFLRTNHGHCRPLSADAFIANSERDSLMTMSPNANIEELKKNGLSTVTILGYYYSWQTACVSHLLSP